MDDSEWFDLIVSVQTDYLGADTCHRSLTVLNGKESQIDIDGETRQVAVEEIDRGAALECKRVLGGNCWQNIDQQLHLGDIAFTHHGLLRLL